MRDSRERHGDRIRPNVGDGSEVPRRNRKLEVPKYRGNGVIATRHPDGNENGLNRAGSAVRRDRDENRREVLLIDGDVHELRVAVER
jgi:hypothetical protein